MDELRALAIDNLLSRLDELIGAVLSAEDRFYEFVDALIEARGVLCDARKPLETAALVSRVAAHELKGLRDLLIAAREGLGKHYGR